MEDSDCPGGRQPQKEIQGPRTSRLKVRRHSYNIKKVPLPPRPPPRQPPQPPPGPLFIEHDVSRRVIHINAADFKTLVQRLTGMDSTSSSSASSSSPYSSCKDTSGGAISPLEGNKDPIIADHIHEVPHDSGVEKGIRAQRQPQNSRRIIRPSSWSLPTKLSRPFSPLMDPNTLGLYHSMNPLHHGSTRSYVPNYSSSGSGSLPATSPHPSPPLMDPNTLVLYPDLNSAPVHPSSVRTINMPSPSADDFSLGGRLSSASSLDFLNNVLNEKDG